jgi:hypothetical protein
LCSVASGLVRDPLDQQTKQCACGQARKESI